MPGIGSSHLAGRVSAGARVRAARRPPRVRAGRVCRPGASPPRRPSSEPRDRALAMAARLRHRAAAGDARPRRRAARRPAARAARRRPCWPRCGSGCSSCCSSTASPTTPRSTRASSWPSGRRRAAPAWSTRCCAGRPGRARHARRARRRDARAAAVARTRCPAWLAELWWDELGAERGARACSARVNEPAESALRVNTLRRHPGRGAPTSSRGGRGRPRPGLPEGLVLDGPFDAHALRAVAGGRDPAAVARARCSSSRVLGPAARGAGARPVRGPGRQDDPPGGADGRTRARSSRSSATRAGPTALERTLRAAAAPACVDGRRRRRGRRRADRAVRPRAGRPAVQRARHAPVAAGPALARQPGAIAELAALQAADPRRRRRGACAGRRAGLLGLHDLPRRERGSHRGLPARPPDFGVDEPRRLRAGSRDGTDGFFSRSPHRDGTDGFFIARLRR